MKTVFKVQIQFGDCDPAGIVFFPNFSKWMDAAALHFFMSQGVPPWRELVKTTGIIGIPLLEINTRFTKPATYGEAIEIQSEITEWRPKVFIMQHIVTRDETLICEGTEVRAFCIRDGDRMKAIEVPADIKAKCS